MKAAKTLALFMLCFSCTGKSPQGNYNTSQTIKLHEGNWLSNFKNEVFIRCLKKLYPKSFTTFIDSSDASSSANIDRLDYNKEVLKLADSLADGFVKRPEATWSIENAKVTMNVCMSYRNSAELDSVAVLLDRQYRVEE